MHHPFCDPFYAALGDIYFDLADRTLGGQLGPAIATVLFACVLPMQGLWWLGRRSLRLLPPILLQWFIDVRNKLSASGQGGVPTEGTPTYQALADLLKRAFKQLEKTFLDDLTISVKKVAVMAIIPWLLGFGRYHGSRAAGVTARNRG